MARQIENDVASHYARPGLLQSILEGLEAQGSNLDALTTADLAPVDEFHTAGRLATERAFAITPVAAGMHVLDAGCGIGGTSRYLAQDLGCEVTGLDLTPEYIEVASALADRMRVQDRCRFEVGSATRMPFGDDSFDGATNFHVAMNIEDRPALYGELARVVKPGGFLCVFDVMKGPTAGMRYPVPWAETETTSFLQTRDDTVRLIEDAGMAVTAEDNMRDFAIGFFEKVFANAAKADGPPPLGLHLLTGANTADKFGNYAQALNDHQIEPVVLVARKS